VSVQGVLIGIVREVITELGGSNAPEWSVEKVAAAVADKVKESIAATIASELRVYANALGMVLATDELADAASRLLIKLREAEAKPGTSFGSLPVEIVSELPKEPAE
jgi:hypothetical protein